MKIREHKAYKDKSPLDRPFERWWTSDDDTVHADMVQLIKIIEENQKDELVQNVRHAYLYNSHSMSAISQRFSSSSVLPERYNVTYNVVKSTTDTVTARIAQRELRPRVLTEKGDYAKQQRSKKLSKYLDGALKEGNVYRLGPEILKDACIFGTGAMKVLPDMETGKVHYERALVHEILVDNLEARYGDPKSLYQRRLVSRDLLAEQFPEKASEIFSAALAQEQRPDTPAVDMVTVYEGWHIGKKNRHVIAIETCTLLDQPWEWDCFPFAFCKYTTKVDSFFGQGIAEELLGTQLEINKLLRDIQRAQHLIAVPRVLVSRASKIVSSHINNEIGGQVKYDGPKPDFVTPSAMNSEIYNHVKWLVQTSYEKVGVSTLAATGKKPAGLDSRPALREFANIESERFFITEMNYQNFFEDIAKVTIKWSKEIYKNKSDLKVKTEDRKFMETISWKDVDLDEDSITTKVFVSSLLPTSPSAKLQKIEEYVRAGWMDRETALQQFNHPDIDAWETLETADKDYVESVICDILEKGEYRAPEPESDPAKAVNLARKAYLEALRNGAPEENLELLLRWIDAAASLLPELSAPAAPALGQAAATPQALPESGILPQVTPPIPGV